MFIVDSLGIMLVDKINTCWVSLSQYTHLGPHFCPHLMGLGRNEGLCEYI